MPRSFLVKKYFTNKKPNYGELESQTGPRFAMVPERFPSAELPTENGSVVPHFPGLVWDMGALPLSFAPVSPTTPSGPLDLSSPFSSSASSSSASSSSSSGDEDEGRTSDPPSPDPTERFQCAHCGKTCSSPTALSRHQLSHCGRTTESVITPSAITTAATTVPPTGRSSFHCKHCPKEYTSLGALKMHIRSHTLPCVCTTCGKAFSRPWLLRGHIRTHTGERPFSCQHCNRAFADRSNLRAHLQTHSEVKKYQCGTCSRTFSRMSLLHKHTVSGGCLPAQ